MNGIILWFHRFKSSLMNKLLYFPQEMISVQDRLGQKIPGFKFNMGFSGRSFKQGDEEEHEEYDALIEHVHKFTWFDHEQPHKHTYADIVRSLNKDEEFARVPRHIHYVYFIRTSFIRTLRLRLTKMLRTY